MSIEAVMPSNHLILYHPLLFLPSIFPNIKVFSNESALLIRKSYGLKSCIFIGSTLLLLKIVSLGDVEMIRIWKGVILPRLCLGINTYLFASAPEQGRLQRILLSFPHLGAHSTVKMAAILSSLSAAPVCYPNKPATHFLNPCCDLNTQFWLEVWNWLWCHYNRNLTEIMNFVQLWKISLRPPGLFKYSKIFWKTVQFKIKSTNAQAQNHIGCFLFFGFFFCLFVCLFVCF